MSKAIHLGEIDHLGVRPRYVMIVGGIASGKNHVIHQHIRTIPVMDVDDIMESRGFTDYSGHHFAEAMKEIGSVIVEMMAGRKCLIAMGTSSNLTNAINRLHSAKMAGYSTVMAYIDAPVEQCLAQNAERRGKGKRFVADEELRKIERTNVGAAQVAATLRDTVLVDFYAHYLNVR
jgi:predicted kinase